MVISVIAVLHSRQACLSTPCVIVYVFMGRVEQPLHNSRAGCKGGWEVRE